MAKQQKQPPKIELASKKVQNEKPLDEFVIKEIMIQKGVDGDAAIHILNNPTTGREKR